MGQNETKRDGNKKIHISEYSCALVGKREEGGEMVGLSVPYCELFAGRFRYRGPEAQCLLVICGDDSDLSQPVSCIRFLASELFAATLLTIRHVCRKVVVAVDVLHISRYAAAKRVPT